MRRCRDILGITLTLAALLAALTLPPAAGAVNAPPKALQIVALVAHHPTSIACDADVNPGPNAPPPGFTVAAWTTVGTGPIHMRPDLCSDLALPIGTQGFAAGIRVLLREGFIAGEARSEACAEFGADWGVYDVLRQFYGVPFFTALSRSIGGQVLDLARRAPANFQPELCRWPG